MKSTQSAVGSKELLDAPLNRNLKPHKESIAAMYLWGKEYSQQDGGCMDFYDSLREQSKQLCRELVDEILNAPSREESV